MVNFIKWVKTNSRRYSSLQSYDDNTIYFLEDTRLIYKGNSLYTSSIEYVEKYPYSGVEGKLYVNTNDSTLKIWKDKWIEISKSGGQLPEISNSLSDDDTDNGLVTGEAIKKYTNDKILKISGSGNAVVSEDIKAMLDKPLGGINNGDIIKKGTTLTDVIRRFIQKRILPVYTMPYITSSVYDNVVECGTPVTPNYYVNYVHNDGGYISKYILIGPDDHEIINTNGIKPYNAPKEIVPEGYSSKYKAVLTYGDGPIKKDNLGNDDVKDHIKSGTLTQDLYYIGCRKMFYGTNKTDGLNSSIIRQLTGQLIDSNLKSQLQSQFSTRINVSVGDKNIIIALPKDVFYNLRLSVKSEALNLDVTSVFELKEINVEGANGFDSKNYDVYVYTPKIPFGSSDVYDVTIQR